jgi:hypothetical protein
LIKSNRSSELAVGNRMSARLQNQQRVQRAAHAAIAADGWVGAAGRQRAIDSWSVDPQLRPLLAEIATIPRIARRLPNTIGSLLQVFVGSPELSAWLRSEDEFLQLCRMTGAALYGQSLRRFVDGDDVMRLTSDLGTEAWRFGIEHGLDNAPADLSRTELTDALLAAGLRAVHTHLQATLPEHVDAIATALDLDWSDVADGEYVDPGRDAEALRRVLAHVRTP